MAKDGSWTDFTLEKHLRSYDWVESSPLPSGGGQTALEENNSALLMDNKRAGLYHFPRKSLIDIHWLLTLFRKSVPFSFSSSLTNRSDELVSRVSNKQTNKKTHHAADAHLAAV